MQRPGEELDVDPVGLAVDVEVVVEVAFAGLLVRHAVGCRDDDDLAAVVRDGEHRLPGVPCVLVTRELVEQDQRADLAVAGAAGRRETDGAGDASVLEGELNQRRGASPARRLRDLALEAEMLGQRVEHVEHPVDDLDRLVLVDRHDQDTRPRLGQQLPERVADGEPCDPQLPRLQHQVERVREPLVDRRALPEPSGLGVVHREGEALAAARVDALHMVEQTGGVLQRSCALVQATCVLVLERLEDFRIRFGY
jgi:hypothetical protein